VSTGRPTTWNGRSAARADAAMAARAAQIERDHPGYHDRHWAAGMAQARVMKLYGALLVAAYEAGRITDEEMLRLVFAAQDRCRRVEEDWHFRVTSRPVAASR
jgi:hypothetical protein